MLRHLGVKYVTLNPDLSFRGLHDSLVNRLGNKNPQMLLCLHEEHAASIAHGYAKVAGEPLAVIMHCNVGLMHGSMAVFNAWCDRVPMLVYGATGPVDAALRRPWIDWLHTSRDQGSLVRNFTKWDDQPASVEAAIPRNVCPVGLEELLRRSGVVSLHVPLNAATRGVIGEKELLLMKTDAVLVNTARGGLIYEAALLRVLKAGRLSGVGLDVFELEPLAPARPLRQCDRVILTPHVLGHTVDLYEVLPTF